MAAIDEPCQPWIGVEDVYACVKCAPSQDGAPALDAARVEDMIAVASAWLWRLTARRFSGECEVTVRPVGDGCGGPLLTSVVPGSFDSSTGTYLLTGWRPQGRGEGVPEVTLGFFPVRTIEQVKIDGATFSDWRLDDARWLVRTDGSSWPRSQRLELEDTEEDTWSVRLTYGDDPPADGRLACAVLACELVQANLAPDKTRLGPRVTSIARQGISAIKVDPLALLTDGGFGLPETDMFIRTTNPYGLAQRAQVFSPDMPRAVRRTGTVPGS